MLVLINLWEAVNAFFEMGGPVLVAVAAVTFMMWTLIFERVWYYKTALSKDLDEALKTWEARTERKSWNAHKIREKLISQVAAKVSLNLDMVATFVALCPLMGLLGTVTGMIDVFEVLGLTGGGDARQLAGGVSKATIPTMAGMVAAISGVFGKLWVNGIASRETQLLEDHLTMDH
jgi:biopolymer transport protein ExbB